MLEQDPRAPSWTCSWESALSGLPGDSLRTGEAWGLQGHDLTVSCLSFRLPGPSCLCPHGTPAGWEFNQHGSAPCWELHGGRRGSCGPISASCGLSFFLGWRLTPHPPLAPIKVACLSEAEFEGLSCTHRETSVCQVLWMGARSLVGQQRDNGADKSRMRSL